MSIVSKFLNKTAIVSGLVALSLISIPVAEAAGQGRGKGRIAQSGGGGGSIASYRGSRAISNRGGGRSFNNRRGGRSFSNRGGGRSFYRGGRSNRYYRGGRRGYGGGAALLTGLVGGALLYSAFNRPRYNSHVDVNYSYGRPYRYNSYYGPSYRYYGRPRTEVIYVDRPVQQVPVYTQAPQQNYVQNQQQIGQNSNCLQSREYTTTIEIGGESLPAYGQACLQQDGSWKFGDPVAVPSF